MLINTATLRASAGSVAGVNQAYQDTGKLGFILDKEPQLTECPRVVLPPLAMSNRDAVADTFEVFKGYSPPAVFGLCNNTLTDNVIGVSSESLLLLGAFLEKPLGCLRAIGLELRAQFGMALSQAVHLAARVGLAVRIGGDIDGAQVNAKKLRGVIPRRLFHLACLQKVKFSLPANEVCLPSKVLKKLKLMLTGNERDPLAPITRPDGYSLPGQVPGKDTLIVGDTAAVFEDSLGGTVEFVGIGHFRQHPDYHLCREIKSITDVVVKNVVQVILAKSLCLPSMVTDIVGRIVHRLQSRKQGFMLLFSRLQLNLGNQLHTCIIAYHSRLDKKGGGPAFLCRLKTTVSCRYFL